jgi:FkbM family methyltransferase
MIRPVRYYATARHLPLVVAFSRRASHVDLCSAVDNRVAGRQESRQCEFRICFLSGNVGAIIRGTYGMVAFVSYAQNFEDVLLWRALNQVTDGFYIDVGANDPTDDSVTRAFYERGWRGINIEPEKKYFDRLVAQRSRDINLNIALGSAKGRRTLYDVVGVRGLATLDAKIAQKHKDQGRQIETSTIPVLTLAQVCRTHVRGPVHFLKIDVEGSEAAVLRGADFRVVRPWILVIEATLPNTRVLVHEKWEHFVLKRGYQYCYFDSVNCYYVAEEHAELAQYLAMPPSVWDDFVVERMVNAGRTEVAAAIAQAESRRMQAEQLAEQVSDRADAAERSIEKAQVRAAVLETRAREAAQKAQASEERALRAEALAQDAEERARAAETTVQTATARVVQAETASREATEILRHAEERILAAEALAREVGDKARDAEEQLQQAEARARQVEEKLRQADERTVAAEALAREAGDKARDAEEQLQQAEARTRQVEEKLRRTDERTVAAEALAREARDKARDAEEQLQQAQMRARQEEERRQQAEERASSADALARQADERALTAELLTRLAEKSSRQAKEIMWSAEAAAQRAEARVLVQSSEAQSARAQANEAQEWLAAIRASTSWRITAPLRGVARAGKIISRLPLRGLFRAGNVTFKPSLRALCPVGKRFLRPTGRRSPASVGRRHRPTIFVECTHTFHSDLNTGIQRVVRNILRHAVPPASKHGFEVVPVRLENGIFVYADLKTVLADKQDTRPAKDSTIRMHWWHRICRSSSVSHTIAEVPFKSLDDFQHHKGNILLLLDSSWHIDVWPAVARMKEKGAYVAAVIYDLVPLTHPHTCVQPLVDSFRNWFTHVGLLDSIITISQSTKSAVETYLKSQHIENRRAIPKSFFHLGSELDLVDSSQKPRDSFRTLLSRLADIFLVVGSIEPRKNHGFVLDAFDQLWAADSAVSLIIIGKRGWKSEDFVARVESHSQYGKRLFLLRDVSDVELDYAYRHASALVIASQIEGFGLPVVEAFQRGLPVLCSDIPVFREIADGKAIFFGLDNPANLAHAVEQFITESPRVRGVSHRWIGWRDSAEQLVDALAAQFHAASQRYRPTIFVECTHTFHTDQNTGIQRVVRNILRHAAPVAAKHDFDVVPIRLENGKFIPAHLEMILANKQNSPSAKKVGATSAELQFDILGDIESHKGNIMLLLDGSWHLNIWPAVSDFKKRGGYVIAVIHDIVPLTHSHTCIGPLVDDFRNWFNHVDQLDALIAVSKFTKSQVESYLASQHPERAGMPISFFYHGTELDLVDSKQPRPGFRTVLSRHQDTFIVVGSIEPRKNHGYILDAFDQLWDAQFAGSLIIIGRNGWKCEEFVARVEGHPLYGKKLFLLRDVSDVELDYAYRHASALVIASEVEGFGLPIVEAFQRGLPVLCSDIPVFREIADEMAIFFNLGDPTNLANAVKGFIAGGAPLRRRLSRSRWIGWRESAERLFETAISQFVEHIEARTPMVPSPLQTVTASQPQTVTVEDVRYAYRILLDREPESSVALNRRFDSRLHLRTHFLTSEEFSKYSPQLSPLLDCWVIKETSHGFRIFVSLNDLYISRNILLGAYEESEVDVVKSIIRPGDAVIDVGANIGFYTMLFAKLVGSAGEVIAFEPLSELYAAAVRSKAENGFGQNCTLHNMALSDSVGKAALRRATWTINFGGAYLSDGVSVPPGHIDEEVNTARLDDYITNKRCAFIKLDVEGAEAKVIRGGIGLLERDKPIILSELHTPMLKRVSGCTADDFIEMMRVLGYKCVQVSTRAPIASHVNGTPINVLFEPISA